MKLQTPVTDDKCKVNISYKDSIMMLGSCLSDNIGSQLANYGFDICINPFGTIYNPESILASVKRIISRKPFTAEDCVEIGAGDSRLCSFSHHTSFARSDVDEFLNNANEKLNAAADFFSRCNKVVLILGTSWCFRHLEKDFIVSNCLKRNPKEFRRELLSVERSIEILNEILTLCPDKEFIFMLCPIRHAKDGAHGNQISKASLLIAAESVMNERCDYFPAYEIMMDELRDYRFYAEDMYHPTNQSINYIVERLFNWALPQQEHELLKENIRTYRRGCHIIR